MNRIFQKLETLGGVISTTNITSDAEYKRIHRATQRGELTKLHSEVYVLPDVLLDTMLDIDRIVVGGIVCLYNAWSHYRPTTTVSPSFCVAIERKRKVFIPPTLPITLHYWKKDYLSLGVTEAVLSGHTSVSPILNVAYTMRRNTVIRLVLMSARKLCGLICERRGATLAF